MGTLLHHKLNIGCGRDIKQGYINLDIYPAPGVDLVHDIEQPWPFPDQIFSEILAHHILEHVHNLVSVMNEAFRTMARGGRLSIKVPWWAGEWARGDPSHIRFFDHNSFSPFSDWFTLYRHLHIAGPWCKLSQNYNHRPQDANSQFLKAMGFSTCRQMHLILQRPQH